MTAEWVDAPIAGSMAWRGGDLADDRRWILCFSQTEIDEIEAAAHRVVDAGLRAPEFRREDFPLPGLADRFGEILQALRDGRGLVLLRGLPVTRWDEPVVRALYWGLALHLGRPVVQNVAGDLIGTVTDRGFDYDGINVRGHKTNAALAPHNDAAGRLRGIGGRAPDIVGLLCVRSSPSGGESQIASAAAVYNEILVHHPEHLAVLRRGFFYDLRGEGAPGEESDVTAERIPVFQWIDGRLLCRFNAKAIETAQRKTGQTLSPVERQAIARMTAVATAPGIRLDMAFEPGDIQLLSNYQTLHARAAYRDDAGPDRRRLLYRLWMAWPPRP